MFEEEKFDQPENPDILLPVAKTSEMKSWMVDYVGEKLQPENDEVNVEMVIEVMAEEFPEILLAIAEENYVRGYQQAAYDIKAFEVSYKEELPEHIYPDLADCVPEEQLEENDP